MIEARFAAQDPAGAEARAAVGAAASTPAQSAGEPVPVPELQSVLASLWQHSETLVRQELALVKAEYEPA